MLSHPGLSLAETAAGRTPRPPHLVPTSSFLESRFPAGAMQELAWWPLVPGAPAAPQSRLWAAGPTRPLLILTPDHPSEFAQMPVLPRQEGPKRAPGLCPPRWGPAAGCGGASQAGQHPALAVDGCQEASRDSGLSGWGRDPAAHQGARPRPRRGSARGRQLRPARSKPPVTFASPKTRLHSALGIRGFGACAVRRPLGGRLGSAGAQGPGRLQPAAGGGLAHPWSSAACATHVLHRVLTVKSAREENTQVRTSQGREKVFTVCIEKQQENALRWTCTARIHVVQGSAAATIVDNVACLPFPAPVSLIRPHCGGWGPSLSVILQKKRE